MDVDDGDLIFIADMFLFCLLGLDVADEVSKQTNMQVIRMYECTRACRAKVKKTLAQAKTNTKKIIKYAHEPTRSTQKTTITTTTTKYSYYSY